MKIDKILKVEMNFSVLKFMCLDQIASDLMKPGASKLAVYLLQ